MVAAVASTNTAFFISEAFPSSGNSNPPGRQWFPAERLHDTRVPPHVPAPRAGYHVLPVRTIALIGLKPVRRHNLRLRCRRWVIRVVPTAGQSLPVYPHEETFSLSVGMSQRCQRSKPLAR